MVHMKKSIWLLAVLIFVVVSVAVVLRIQDRSVLREDIKVDESSGDTPHGEVSFRTKPAGTDGVSEKDDEHIHDDSHPHDDISFVTVTYTDEGFAPKVVTIKAGERVVWVNESSQEMWVGSDNHPTHTNYGGTVLREHCPDTGSNSFDQCESGETFVFNFTRVGEWGYHNHRNPRDAGTIIVQ